MASPGSTRARASARVRVPLALALGALGLSPAAAQVVVPWLGGTGSWTDPLRWTLGTPPINTGLLHFTAQIGSGEAQLNTAVAIDSLELTGGVISGASTLTLEGTAVSLWSAGTLSGTGTLRVNAGAALSLTGGGTKTYNRADGISSSGGRTIENFGTITVLGLGNLLGGEGGQILNRSGALFDLKEDITVGFSGVGAAPTFSNAGLVRKSAGAGTVVFDQIGFTNSGTVEVSSGNITFASAVTSNAGAFNAADATQIIFLGGQTFNAGTNFTGAGLNLLNGGTTTINGGITSTNLRFVGGTLQGTGTVTGLLEWTGGAWSGTGTLTIPSGSGLTVHGAANKIFNRADGISSSGGRTIENFGTITWTGSGQLLGGEGAQIVNRAGGEFVVTDNSTLGFNGVGAAPAFNNQGTVRKITSGGTTTISGLTFQNTGQVTAETGTLAFTSSVSSTGGNFTSSTGANILFSGGQSFDGTMFLASGTIVIAGGNTTLAGNLSVSNLEFAGGALFGDATVAGTLRWTDGVWRNPSVLTMAAGSTLTLAGTAAKTITRADGISSNGGRIVRTAGTIEWLDAGAIVGNEGAGFDVLGTGLLKILNNSTYGHGGTGTMPFLTNAGTVRKLGSSGTTTFDSVVFTNNGRLEIQSGTLALTGSGGLANNGIVEVQSGLLTSSASGGTSTGGLFDVFSGSQLRFTGGTNTIVGSTFAGGGLTEVAGGTLVVASGSVTGNLQLLSGTIGGAGVFSVASGADFIWQGGSLIGTGTLAIQSGGELRIEGPAAKSFFRNDGISSSGGRVITNLGLVTWSGTGDLLGGEGGLLHNLSGGIFEITNNAMFGYNGIGVAPTFVNEGLVHKSAGAGITDLSRTFTNHGTAQSNAGTLRISGGGSGAGQFIAIGGAIEFAAGYTLNHGAKILGTSPARVTGGSIVVPAAATVGVGSTSTDGLLSFEGGTLDGGGLLLVDTYGRMDWSGGLLRGTGTLRIAAGGVLYVQGGVDHDFVRADGISSSGGRTIENFGTMHWTGGNLRGGEGGQIINRGSGLFAIQTNGTLGYTGTGAVPTFTNEGTFRLSSPAPVSVSSMPFTNTGSVEVQAGSLTFNSSLSSTGGSFSVLAGGTLTFAGSQSFSGTTFAGAGLISAAAGTTTLGGTITASRLTFAGGSLWGTAALAGTLEWTGGEMQGPHTLTIHAGSTLQLSGAGDRTFRRADGISSNGGRTIENFGTLLVQNSGAFLGGEGGQLVNRAGGFIDFQTSQILGYSGVGANPSFTNEGAVQKSISTGTMLVSGMPFTNAGSGQVSVLAGTLQFDSATTSHGGVFSASPGATLVFNSTQTFNTGTALTGPGLTKAAGGTTTFSGSVSAQNFELAGGSLLGTATLAAGSSMKWTGGDMRGPHTFTLASGTTLDITGTGDRSFLRGDGISGSGGRIIENQGLLIIQNTGNLLGNEGGQVVNRTGGLVDIRNNATLGFGGTGATASVTNEGVFAKSAGGATSTVALPFTNTGSVSVSSGTLAFTSSFTNTNGSVLLMNGATLSLGGPLDTGTGVLSGSGTIVAPTVNAGSVVTPGVATGTLAITGNLALLGTSALLLEIGGTGQGSTHDFLSVSGTGAMGGQLALMLTNGFVPTGGLTFTVLATTGLSGTFGNVANGQRLLTTDGLGSFQVNYGSGSLFAANAVVLSHWTPVPEPSTWALLITGLLAGAVHFRRRRARR